MEFFTGVNRADCFQQTLNINLTVNNLWGVVTAKSALAVSCYFYSGRIGEQLKLTSEAVTVAEESGDIHSKAQAYATHGCSLYGLRSLEEAEKYPLKGIELSDKIGLHVWNGGAQYYLGEIHFEREAIEQLGKAIEILKECGATGWVTKYEEEMAKLA